ncbi:hypothetical protein I312_104148 [Cryptococcus bacillisporus CA1280]|uniref:uncharacterized protein n=1 Tax=Cryptococcus bacillisporus CA1280 TaxID=1296109 RepID=UPI0033674E32
MSEEQKKALQRASPNFGLIGIFIYTSIILSPLPYYVRVSRGWPDKKRTNSFRDSQAPRKVKGEISEVNEASRCYDER